MAEILQSGSQNPTNIFFGLSSKHEITVSNILNLNTITKTPQLHVVYEKMVPYGAHQQGYYSKILGQAC